MKKKIFLILAIILVASFIVGGFLYLNRETSIKFTTEEERWLSANKNNIIEIYIPRNITGFTYMGKGVFFDFIESLENRTGLTFNKVAYEAMEDVSDKNYAIELVDEVLDNQIFILQDNYVVISKENNLYTDLSGMKDLTIGILESEQEEIEKYFEGANVEFKTFETSEEIEEEFEKEEEASINAFIGLKSLYLDDILTKDYHIAYHIVEMTKNYVITLRGEETLNSIIKKSFENWSKDNLESSYNNNLLEAFYEHRNITEKEKTTLREKSYIYAFNENGAYDTEKGNKLSGINYQIVKSFAEFANIDMEYAKGYENKEALVAAFNEGKVDFAFRNNVHELTIDYYDTAAPITASVVILTDVNNSIPVTTLHSLSGKKVSVVKGTRIEDYLLEKGLELESYDSINELLKAKKSNSIIAIDLENYEYYKTTDLSKFKISHIFNLPENYGYTVNGNDKLFAELFNFYLEYMPIQDIIHKGYRSIFVVEDSRIYYWIAIIILALIVIIQFFYNAKRALSSFKKKHKKTFTKNEKIRYIDSLTSLKNRAYLNDVMEKWDNSEIYPQMIVIIDLNNIAYINDNFGHEEGDKVITEAANILIKTQMPRTEIIRTDGNEFLVYLVEYEEKEVNSYVKKLSKDFKELSHGFGAAIGSSIIRDALKTIDDAINEATLDMKNNKEAMTSEEK